MRRGELSPSSCIRAAARQKWQIRSDETKLVTVPRSPKNVNRRIDGSKESLDETTELISGII